MIILSQAVRIVIATKPVDFRKGHDGLAAVAQQQLSLDPHSGVIVVFRAKRGDRIKERWSRNFEPVVKVDRMMKVTIQNEETKEPFARV